MRLPLWGTKPLCSIGAAPGFVLFPEGGSRSRFPRGDINDLRKEWPTTAPITAGQRAQNLPKSTSSGSPSSSTSARLYCRLRYWQMFCVTTLLTSCLAYRKHSRIPTGHMPASGRPEACKSPGKPPGQVAQKRNYLLSTELDPQCEKDPLQVSPV